MIIWRMKISRKRNCGHWFDAFSRISSRVVDKGKKDHAEKFNRVKSRNNLNHPMLSLNRRVQGESTKVALVVICVLSSSLFWKSPWKVYVRASLYQFAITGSLHILAGKDVPNEEFASSMHLHGMVAGCTG